MGGSEIKSIDTPCLGFLVSRVCPATSVPPRVSSDVVIILIRSMRSIVVAVVGTLASARAGSIELSSSDLKGGVGLDNVKGSWSRNINVKGADLKLSASYDVSALASQLAPLSSHSSVRS